MRDRIHRIPYPASRIPHRICVTFLHPASISQIIAMKKLFLLMGSMLCIVLSQAQDTARTDATLSTATVYFGYGAELTHKSKVRITPETKFIVINRLSTQVDINSLQISCPEDVALLSHKYNIFTPVRPVVVRS